MNIINPYFFTVAAQLLLDIYPNAASAYSLRKLRTAYSGSAIRVRRDFDNTEQDVGFDGSGNLNTATLQSFVGYQNLILQSQEFNTSWSAVQVSVSVNTLETTDPLGGNTADKFNETASTNVHLVFQSGGTTTGLNTISVYAKKGIGRDWIRISHDGGSSKTAYFNINNGTVGNVSAGLQNAVIQSVGNGWYRCSVEITNKVNTGNFAIGIAESNGVESYLGVASNYTYFWGAQLNIGSLQNYQQTTTVVRNANGFVTTWYDQSTNLSNAVQTTATRQPFIVISGVLQTRNNKPCVRFIGTSLHHLIMPYFADPSSNFGVFSVFSVDNRTSNNTIYGTDGYGYLVNGIMLSNSAISFNKPSYEKSSLSSLNLTNNVLASVNHLYLANNTASSSANGVASAFTSMLLNGTPFAKGQIAINTGKFWLGVNVASSGEISSTYSFIGNISEFFTYKTDQSANRTGIENNINAYYSIYWDGSQTGLLNTYSGAAAAYSLRNLSSSYTGALIRVRRSSDNAETDIYGTYQGNLDTSTLLAFCGSGSGFVTTWYDQSGNGRNATQATAANQPRIVNAGVIETQNNKTVVNFIRASTNFLTSTVPDFRTLHGIFAVLKSYGTQDGYDSYFGAGNAGLGNVLWHKSATIDNALGITQPTQNISNNTSAVNANTKLLNAYATSSLLTLTDVGINQSVSGTLTNLTGTASKLILSASENNSSVIADYLSVYFSEFILYNSNQAANRSAINSNINSYYTIY